MGECTGWDIKLDFRNLEDAYLACSSDATCTGIKDLGYPGQLCGISKHYYKCHGSIRYGRALASYDMCIYKKNATMGMMSKLVIVNVLSVLKC